MDEKKLEEKTLEGVTGGLSGEAVDGMYASMFYRNNCIDCARAHKDVFGKVEEDQKGTKK